LALAASDLTDRARLVPYVVAPLANGGIQIEWRNESSSLEVEVDPDRGMYSYLLGKEDETIDERECASRSDVLNILTGWLRSAA
jgi:hypothetical protein